MIGRLRAAWSRLAGVYRPVVVPCDGQPLSDDEIRDLITAMRAFRDDEGTRRVAPLERRAEQSAR